MPVGILFLSLVTTTQKFQWVNVTAFLVCQYDVLFAVLVSQTSSGELSLFLIQKYFLAVLDPDIEKIRGVPDHYIHVFFFIWSLPQ